MFEIIITVLAMIIMFKLTLFLLKLLGKVLGAFISVLGYLLIGGLIVALSIPLVLIPLVVLTGIVSIIVGIIQA